MLNSESTEPTNADHGQRVEIAPYGIMISYFLAHDAAFVVQLGHIRHTVANSK